MDSISMGKNRGFNVKYQSTKTYGNERGLSCCFRQWKANSYCKYLHGYSLGFRFIFETDQLDERNWVYDFGGCGWIKTFLEQTFDHKLLIDKNDPDIEHIYKIHDENMAQVLTMDGVGCEKFAEYVYNYVAPKIIEETKGRVNLKRVEVFEHGSNSASYNYGDWKVRNIFNDGADNEDFNESQ